MLKNNLLLISAITITFCCSLTSCGGFDSYYDTKLTDKFHLYAPDRLDQMQIGYETEPDQYAGFINETVSAVGFNKNFIIAKQHPLGISELKNTKNINFYIIDINSIVEERNKFVSKMDTTKSRMLLKDKEGKDSLGEEEIYISEIKYSPVQPKKLNLKQFLETKKKLKVPDSLSFFISFKELR